VAAEQRQAQRGRLAELLGHLLARYWLRTRRRPPPETPNPNPPAG
jgi:hypothetical protein